MPPEKPTGPQDIVLGLCRAFVQTSFFSAHAAASLSGRVLDTLTAGWQEGRHGGRPFAGLMHAAEALVVTRRPTISEAPATPQRVTSRHGSGVSLPGE